MKLSETPGAVHFKIQSPKRMAGTYQDGTSATKSYEDFKNAHLDTQAACTADGFNFTPMVVEAVGGGWGKLARCVWSEHAKSSALALGELESNSTCAIMLRQRLSMTLHRENARAILRCSPRLAGSARALVAAAATLAGAAAEAAAAA